MVTTFAIDELSHIEELTRVVPERLGWTYVPREALAPERAAVAA